MKGKLLCLLACLMAVSSPASRAAVERPKILGIAHMAFHVGNLPRTLAYYKNFLGFAEPYDLKNDDGSGRISFIKINDYQYLEFIFQPPRGDGMLNRIAFYTDNADQLRRYLISRGVHAPAKMSKG